MRRTTTKIKRNPADLSAKALAPEEALAKEDGSGKKWKKCGHLNTAEHQSFMNRK